MRNKGVRSGNTRVTLSVNESLYKEIRILAAKRGCNPARLIDEGMAMLVKKEKQKKEKAEGG